MLPPGTRHVACCRSRVTSGPVEPSCGRTSAAPPPTSRQQTHKAHQSGMPRDRAYAQWSSFAEMHRPTPSAQACCSTCSIWRWSAFSCSTSPCAGASSAKRLPPKYEARSLDRKTIPTMNCDASALLVVDFQSRLMLAILDGAAATTNAQSLKRSSFWRAFNERRSPGRSTAMGSCGRVAGPASEDAT